MYDMEESIFKRGDIVYWKPTGGRKTRAGQPMAVVGIYLETDKDTGEHMIIDCISWDGTWYRDGVALTKDEIGVPPKGLKYRYWANRKSETNRDRLIWKFEELEEDTDKKEE